MWYTPSPVHLYNTGIMEVRNGVGLCGCPAKERWPEATFGGGVV